MPPPTPQTINRESKRDSYFAKSASPDMPIKLPETLPGSPEHFRQDFGGISPESLPMPPPRPGQLSALKVPVTPERVSSSVGTRIDPALGVHTEHKGIDLVAEGGT